jgi:hypothetical protein
MSEQTNDRLSRDTTPIGSKAHVSSLRFNPVKLVTTILKGYVSRHRQRLLRRVRRLLSPAFKRHLYSTAGEVGLADLADRAQERLGPVTEAWRSMSDGRGISGLFGILVDAITALDSFDLRPKDVPLRPITGGVIPPGMICKLTRALVEYLAQGDEQAERVALESLAAAPRSGSRYEFELGFRAALADFLIEQGVYDQAVAALEENLTVQLCPYSEHLLFLALSAQKKVGAIADSPRLSLLDLSDRFCGQPFEAITTSPPTPGPNGRDAKPALFACSCPSMLPYPLALSRSDEDAGIEYIWNGPEAQEIRRSILEGDFTYCSRTACPMLIQDDLPKKDDITDPVLRDIIDNKKTRIESAPKSIMLTHDVSCNLACPSCRTEVLTIKNDARKVLDNFVDEIILPLMEGANVDLHVAGDGDPFGSKHYRKLLNGLDPVRHRGVNLFILSNGLLLTPNEWESLSRIHHMVKSVRVSIDAAEASTYEDVRRPGKWSTLTQNMEFLAAQRRAGKIPSLGINFVVQAKNFEQMPAFVELGQKWSVDLVVFSKLLPTSRAISADTPEFNLNAVVDERHPAYPRLLEVLRHPILRSKEVDLFNIGVDLSFVSDSDAAVSGLDAAHSIAIAIDEPHHQSPANR